MVAPPEPLSTPEPVSPAPSGSPTVQQVTLLERIDRLCHPGVLRDFSWPADLPPFARRNLIYGWNCSGKTTISEMLRALEERRAPANTRVSLTLNRCIVRESDFPDADMPVRVFNREYVRQNVFPKGGGELPLILVIGRENVEKQHRLDELKESRPALVSARDAALEAAKTADRTVDSCTIAHGDQIRKTLRSQATHRYNNYDKGDFRKAADAAPDTPMPLSDEEYQRLLARLAGSPKQPLTLSAPPIPDIAALEAEVAGIVATTLSVEVIQSLRADPPVATWVHEGLRLHAARSATSCLYCDQPLPSARVARLEAHFSAAYREFLDRLEACRTRLTGAADDLKTWQPPSEAELQDDLREEFRTGKAALGDLVGRLQAHLATLTTALNQKRGSPFDPVAAPPTLGPIDHAPVEAMLKLLEQHNAACAALEARMSAAREAIEQHYISSALPEYRRLKAESASANERAQTAAAAVRELDVTIGTLEREVAGPHEAAQALNEDLRHYLGHDEVQLAVGDGGYTLRRDGAPVTGLSEGEETAIALLYFLKSLEHQGFDRTHGIVVLDDPVSSLDANALFLAFAFIQERVKRVGQLFVLTHNFSFFRQVRRWLTCQSMRDDSQLYMLETTCESGGRTSALRPLDRLLRDYESEYHYLFARVLRERARPAAVPLEDRYVLPNVARRLLEAFLAFKRPSAKGGLDRRVMLLPGSEAKKLRVVRFLHAYSHGGGLTEPEHDPSHLAEAPAALDDLLELIRAEDPQHYGEMLSLCGVLAATPAPRPPSS